MKNQNSPRVSESDKTKRDILLYLLWQESKYTDWGFNGFNAFSSKLINLSVDKFDAIHYAGMTLFKIGILLFNLVPYFALRIVG